MVAALHRVFDNTNEDRYATLNISEIHLATNSCVDALAPRARNRLIGNVKGAATRNGKRLLGVIRETARTSSKLSQREA